MFPPQCPAGSTKVPNSPQESPREAADLDQGKQPKLLRKDHHSLELCLRGLNCSSPPSPTIPRWARRRAYAFPKGADQQAVPCARKGKASCIPWHALSRRATGAQSGEFWSALLANAAPNTFCPQLQQLKEPQVLQMGGHSTGWPAPRFGSAGRTAGPSHHSQR